MTLKGVCVVKGGRVIKYEGRKKVYQKKPSVVHDGRKANSQNTTIKRKLTNLRLSARGV